MKNRKRLDLSITEDTFNKLKALADKKDITISALIRLIINSYITQEEHS